MAFNEDDEITRLLKNWRMGDKEAEGRLFEVLLPELHQIAQRYFRRERPGQTLQPTALVNEAFLRLAAASKIDWQDRGHFLAMAATMMRRFLIDRHRVDGGAQFLPLEGLPPGIVAHRSEFEMAVALDKLLDELGREWPQRKSIVELKFFLGLSDEEAAETLNMKLHTLQREWYRARQWLFVKLSSADGKSQGTSA